MGRKKGSFKQDLASFMCILIMTIGVLVVMLVVNVLIMMSNPDNYAIFTVFKPKEGESDPKQARFANTKLEPIYLDVHPNHMVIYPGSNYVAAADLEVEGNPFEVWLRRLERRKDKNYFLILARPRSAILERKVESIIVERGLGLGVELYDAEDVVEYSATEILDQILAEEAADAALLSGETGVVEAASGEVGTGTVQDATSPESPASGETPPAVTPETGGTGDG